MKSSEPAALARRFMTMRITLLTSVVLAAMVIGCAPPARTGVPPYVGPTLPLTQLVDQINANNAKITTLRCAHTFEATLVDDKGKSHTFSGDGALLYARPDNLLLTAGSIIKYFEI